MFTRRKTLITAGAGIAAAIAGCGDAEQADTDEGGEAADEQPAESEEPETLQNFSVVAINAFALTFSDGLRLSVELRNETEGGTGENRVNVSMEAFAGDELLGADDQWANIAPDGRTETFDLAIEEVDSADEVTELRIFGREDGPEVRLETFSGEEVRSRLD